ncbi:MAG: hypothetical protein WCV86_03690 [Patescibacteria group bacterium]
MPLFVCRSSAEEDMRMWFWIFLVAGLIAGHFAGSWWAGTVIGGTIGVVIQVIITERKKARPGRRRPR